MSNFDETIDRRGTGALKWEKYKDSDVVPMWVADMEFETSPKIIDFIRQRLDHGILGYTQATASTTDAVQSYLRDRHGWSIDPDWLVWIPGVVPALAITCETAGKPDDEILVFTPVYHPLLRLPPKKTRNRVDVPLRYTGNDNGGADSNGNNRGRWVIDFDAFERAITKNSRILLLCSPHNPVGMIFSREELRRLAEICQAHDITIISDEIHCDLILHPSRRHVTTAVAAEELQNQVITLMSPSKTFNLAGANASFAVIPDPNRRKRFSDACLYSVPTVPTLSYAAAEAAYRYGWDWHSELINYLRGNLATLKATVDATPGLWMDDTEATYLAWINTADLPVEDAFDYLLKAGVGLSPGAQFGDSSYQRLNFACSRQQLLQGLERITGAINKL